MTSCPLGFCLTRLQFPIRTFWLLHFLPWPWGYEVTTSRSASRFWSCCRPSVKHCSWWIGCSLLIATGEAWDSTGLGTWVYDSNSRVAITASLTVLGLRWRTASDISGCCSCLKKLNSANYSFASSLNSGYALSARKHKSLPKLAQFSFSNFVRLSSCTL